MVERQNSCLPITLEIAGSRDGRRIFLGGGAIVAMAYRKYFEGQDLEKIFG